MIFFSFSQRQHGSLRHLDWDIQICCGDDIATLVGSNKVIIVCEGLHVRLAVEALAGAVDLFMDGAAMSMARFVVCLDTLSGLCRGFCMSRNKSPFVLQYTYWIWRYR